MKTCHSEYGVIKKVFLKRAKDAFISQNIINGQWKNTVICHVLTMMQLFKNI